MNAPPVQHRVFQDYAVSYWLRWFFCGCAYCKTARAAIEDASDHHKLRGGK